VRSETRCSAGVPHPDDSSAWRSEVFPLGRDWTFSHTFGAHQGRRPAACTVTLCCRFLTGQQQTMGHLHCTSV